MGLQAYTGVLQRERTQDLSEHQHFWVNSVLMSAGKVDHSLEFHQAGRVGPLGGTSYPCSLASHTPPTVSSPLPETYTPFHHSFCTLGFSSCFSLLLLSDGEQVLTDLTTHFIEPGGGTENTSSLDCKPCRKGGEQEHAIAHAGVAALSSRHVY